MTENKDPAVAVTVGPEGVNAQVSVRTLTKIGQAAAWLFPRKDARATITSALAARVAEKIRAGAPLDDTELYFVSRVFEREARALQGAERAAEEVQRVLPEVQQRLLSQADPEPDGAPSRGFVTRAETVASDIADDEIRELFARAVAGELVRPGTISLRTLETVRSLDPEIATAFQSICNYVFDEGDILDAGDVDEYLAEKRLDLSTRLELQDAGLIAQDGISLVVKPQAPLEVSYGEKSIRAEYFEQPKISLAEKGFITTIRLTRVGRELAQVLPFKPANDYFQRVLRGIADDFGKRGRVSWRATASAPWVSVQ